MGNYAHFASYYDLLTKNVSYPQWAKWYDKMIRAFGGSSDSILLDLACGTGSLTEEMARLGYDCIGIDYSDEMLNQALSKKFQSNLPVQYLKQDMTNLDLFGTVDVTLCTLDALNHLSSLKAIDKTIEKVALFTNPGGLFFFDVNTPYKHREILGNHTYVYDMQDVYCIWQNTYHENNCRVRIDLDFFQRRKDGLYTHNSEHFSEYTWNMESFDQILQKHHFKILKHYDFDTQKDTTAQSEKIIFVSQKTT